MKTKVISGGGKNPKWTDVFNNVPYKGEETMYIAAYDDDSKKFSMIFILIHL